MVPRVVYTANMAPWLRRRARIAVSNGTAEFVLGGPLLGHAGQLGIAVDVQRVGGEVADVAEGGGAGKLGVAVHEDADTVGTSRSILVLADASNVAQAVQRRQLVDVAHVQ